MTLSLPIEPDANALLARNPLALLIGMLLDQQVPMERAFSAPFDLVQRLGHEPSAAELADYDPEALTAVFSKPPALHRYPRAMAARVQQMCRVIAEDYDGDAARIWGQAADGKDLLGRLGRLPGFGPQKAQIFVALLGKQLGIQPGGWREAAGHYGEDGAFLSIADIADEASLGKVRAYKQEMKAAAKAARKPAARS
ncbi:MAG: HhH-GPD-type base excision DNA repair protein [Micromonosporaceae bacterium]